MTGGSLWQMSDKEKAETSKIKADTFAIDATHNAVPADTLAKARQGQLIDDGTYPGLEDALEEAEGAENADLDEDDPEVAEQFQRGTSGTGRPRTWRGRRIRD